MVSDMVLDLANTFPGIAQQVTEMDIGFNSTFSDYDDIPASVHAQLGYAYRNYFNAFRQLNGLINSVTIWGQADNHVADLWLQVKSPCSSTPTSGQAGVLVSLILAIAGHQPQRQHFEQGGHS